MMVVVVHIEEMGEIMTEDMGYTVMMVMVPTQVLTSRPNNLSGYCFHSMICNFTNLTSNVLKGNLGVV